MSGSIKPKALFVLDDAAYKRIYGDALAAEVAELVTLVAAPQNRKSILTRPQLLEEVELLLSGWGAPLMDEAFLERAPKLRAVFYGAGSIRAFTTPAFWRRGILVTSAYAANAVPVAEYTLGAILLSLKRFWFLSGLIRREGRYPEEIRVPGAYGSTVGLVSLGMIGRLVRQRLQPFDLEVIAYDPKLAGEEARALGVTPVSLEEVFRRSEVVSLHTPWLKETEGLITGAHLLAMKEGATLINTARGAIIREGEMISALKARPDITAILDVTHPEPPLPDSALYRLPNVLLTPHIAGSLGAECRRMGRLTVTELKRYLAGEPLQWAVSEAQARTMA